MKHSHWNLLPRVPAEYLKELPEYSPLIAQLLYNRGLTKPAEISSFITADSHLAENPWLLPDMHQAVARIYRALLSGENIVIYGDFDTDGITATALLIEGLNGLGARVTPYIPHRLSEGHGLRTGVLERLRHEGADLIITVDCGITGTPEVKKANRMGLDVVITDHHTPVGDIPEAAAVVDPKLPGSAYPFVELAGVGVAFKLLEALLQSIGQESRLSGLMDLVALGTVADMMPLLGENRYLVKMGLELLNRYPRLGIRAIMTEAGLDGTNLDSDTISWVIAPRLNTTGRLEHALPSYQLMVTNSSDEALKLSAWLERKNAQRQKMTNEVVTNARERIMKEGVAPILIVDDDDYPGGLLGLAAGRLSSEFYRPAVVIKTGKQTSHASCRSIREFDIISALNQNQNLFTRFGGHPQAAGFSLPTQNLPELKTALLELAASKLAGLDLRPHLDIDAEVRLKELGGDTYPTMQELAPFGQGNPNPLFLSRGVEVIDCRPIGASGDHLKLTLCQDGVVWDGVAFRAGDCLDEIVSPLDVVYQLDKDCWRGETRLRLNIQDFAASG